MSKPLIILNWKMNPARPSEAAKLFKATVASASAKLNLVVAPPFIYLSELNKIKSGIQLGAQDISSETAGAFTGEISGLMLKNQGVKYVLVGHSERRWLIGESDDLIAAKLSASLRAGFKTVLCVGELKQVSKAQAWSFIAKQIKRGLADVPEDKFKNLIVAYEPVWAIGNGHTATLEHSSFIAAEIKALLGDKTPVLYGGSVDVTNIKSFLNSPDFTGVLVGGASLKVPSVKKILHLFLK